MMEPLAGGGGIGVMVFFLPLNSLEEHLLTDTLILRLSGGSTHPIDQRGRVLRQLTLTKHQSGGAFGVGCAVSLEPKKVVFSDGASIMKALIENTNPLTLSFELVDGGDVIHPIDLKEESFFVLPPLALP